ncbi:hypothetical protein CJ231_10780 [Hoylesella buccalis]|uniref:Uncharacterized protein n=1 Tax=Hoylesella buccalis TaxID=28127 RepID=A0A2N6QNL3_9BACT|nr:hypothetical protein CJ231_10780 [Hoylesella buccalis]
MVRGFADDERLSSKLRKKVVNNLNLIIYIFVTVDRKTQWALARVLPPPIGLQLMTTQCVLSFYCSFIF